MRRTLLLLLPVSSMTYHASPSATAAFIGRDEPFGPAWGSFQPPRSVQPPFESERRGN